MLYLNERRLKNVLSQHNFCRAIKSESFDLNIRYSVRSMYSDLIICNDLEKYKAVQLSFTDIEYVLK